MPLRVNEMVPNEPRPILRWGVNPDDMEPPLQGTCRRSNARDLSRRSCWLLPACRAASATAPAMMSDRVCMRHSLQPRYLPPTAPAGVEAVFSRRETRGVQTVEKYPVAAMRRSGIRREEALIIDPAISLARLPSDVPDDGGVRGMQGVAAKGENPLRKAILSQAKLGAVREPLHDPEPLSVLRSPRRGCFGSSGR